MGKENADILLPALFHRRRRSLSTTVYRQSLATAMLGALLLKFSAAAEGKEYYDSTM